MQHESLYIPPWDVQEGDRILGTSMVARGPAKYRGYIYAEAVGQMKYGLPVTHETRGDLEIPYLDDSKVNVLRPIASAEESD